MSGEETKAALLSAGAYFNTQSQGYKSWGNVSVLRIAQRIHSKSYLLTNVQKPLTELTETDISVQTETNVVFWKIFAARKKVNTILITNQQYASQLKEEVPAILDDQAQLLGVSVRLAEGNNELKALSGRYAAVLPDGNCICLGSSIEDAYVAAQLLEKTAKTFLEAKHIGGAKAINKIEAWFMQQYYLFKYSKEAIKNK